MERNDSTLLLNLVVELPDGFYEWYCGLCVFEAQKKSGY